MSPVKYPPPVGIAPRYKAGGEFNAWVPPAVELEICTPSTYAVKVPELCVRLNVTTCGLPLFRPELAVMEVSGLPVPTTNWPLEFNCMPKSPTVPD